MVCYKRALGKYIIIGNPKHITQMKQENRKKTKSEKRKPNFSSVMQLRLTARQRSHLMIQASRKANHRTEYSQNTNFKINQRQ